MRILHSLFGPYIHMVQAFLWTSFQGVALCGVLLDVLTDENVVRFGRSNGRYVWLGYLVWGGRGGSFLKIALKCCGSVWCGRGVDPQGRVSMSGGDSSGARVSVMPHEDPCVWVLPRGRPVDTPRLAGAIGAQLQVSQQLVWWGMIG